MPFQRYQKYDLRQNHGNNAHEYGKKIKKGEILNAYQNKTNSFFNIDSDVINYFKPRIQYATYDLKETENKRSE